MPHSLCNNTDIACGYNGFLSIKCRCDMAEPVCDPSDQYTTVAQLDNSEGTLPAEMKYKKVNQGH